MRCRRGALTAQQWTQLGVAGLLWLVVFPPTVSLTLLLESEV
jgi:hypothetical protein